MSRSNFENLEVYRLAERLADEVWAVVIQWAILPRDTVGKQLVRAADSIGTNLAEGVGRGSLNETKHWLRRAYRRGLLDQPTIDRQKAILEELAPRLNAYLKSIGPSRNRPIASDLAGEGLSQ